MAKFWEKMKKIIGGGAVASKEESETVTKIEPRVTPKGNDRVSEKTEGETSYKGDKVSEISGTDGEGAFETTSGMGEKISGAANLFIANTKKLVSLLGKKAPQVAETVAEKTKILASVVSEKTGEAVAFSKLKIKIRNLKNHVEQTKSELGGRTYELMKENRTDIYEDDAVNALIEKVKSLNGEIEATQKEIEELQEDEKTGGD